MISGIRTPFRSPWTFCIDAVSIPSANLLVLELESRSDQFVFREELSGKTVLVLDAAELVHSVGSSALGTSFYAQCLVT